MSVIDTLRKLGGCEGGIQIFNAAKIAAAAANIGRERKKLKSETKTRMKKLFPKLNLNRVRFVINADLPANWFGSSNDTSAMTFGYTIYFKGQDIQWTYDGLLLLIHELVHVDQVRRRHDSERDFACDYGKGFLLAGNYRSNPLEVEAYNFVNLLPFNPLFYLNQYSDLRDTFGATNYFAAITHWLDFGINEGRRSSRAFDVGYYLSQYPDLQTAFGAKNYAAALHHWLEFGINEGRMSSPAFDVGYYLSQYPDLQTAFGATNYLAAIEHWLEYGLNEGRRSSREFDVSFYLSQYPDLQTAFGAKNYTAAFDHWLAYGMSEGRRGAP